jgi:hypothetical protein
MVFTVAVPDNAGTGWSRRTVLAAAAATGAAVTVTGCTWFEPEPPPPPPDPLEPLLAGTRGLAGRHDRTLLVHPGLAGRLEPLRATHLAHVAALLEAIGRPGPATPAPATPAPATPAPAGSPPDPGGIPADDGEAVEQLREHERDASEQARQACLEAPPDRVALLGSICAARASHVEVLS